MFLDKQRLIFVHIPKTAGNFLQNHLFKYSSDQRLVKSKQDGVNRFGVRGTYTSAKHAKIQDYRDVMPEDLFRRCRIMTSVRHPFERVISGYFSPHRWVKAEDGVRTFEPPVFDEVEFAEFVRASKPMAAWLALDDTTVVPDILIRFEWFEADVRRVFPKLGLDVPVSFTPVNASAIDKSKYLQSRSLESLAIEHLRQDYELFDYQRMA